MGAISAKERVNVILFSRGEPPRMGEQADPAFAVFDSVSYRPR